MKNVRELEVMHDVAQLLDGFAAFVHGANLGFAGTTASLLGFSDAAPDDGATHAHHDMA